MATEQIRGRVITVLAQEEVIPTGYINPAYFEDQFLDIETLLKERGAIPLGEFLPELHADGAKGITYGQVGGRELDSNGAVRYLQVINIRDTGIDFAIKPDRVAQGSNNDPARSRVQKGDILLTNTAFRGTDTLIGRCVVVHRDYGKLNISQDIDRLRVTGVNAYYVGTFLKSHFGQQQLQRFITGVDSQKINFGRIRGLLIPDLARDIQAVIEKQYLETSGCHDRAMAIKERLLAESGIQPGQYGEAINALAMERPAYRRAMAEAKARLDHLIAQLEAVIEGKQQNLKPYAE